MRTVLRDCLLPGGERADVAVEGGVIAAIGECGGGDLTINVEGHLLIPGAIDCHVHFRDFRHAYKEDWLSGTAAAAAGGVTTVLEMPNTSPPSVDRESLLSKCALAGKGSVNYGLHLGATAETCAIIAREGLAVSGRLPSAPGVSRCSAPEELNRPCEGPPDLPIASLKIFFGSTTGNLLIDRDEVLEEIFRCWSGIFTAHCEDEKSLRQAARSTGEGQTLHEQIRGREAALQALEKYLAFGERYGRRIHVCHVSTREEISLIRNAREKGLPVSAEATPHHLFLCRDDALTNGNLLKVNPPLREKEDCESLRQALIDGTIDCIASDHAPHTVEEKRRPYREAPSGLPGIETAVPLTLTFAMREGIPVTTAIRWLSEKPAGIFGLRGRGKLEPGAAADLTVVVLTGRRAVRGEGLRTKARWSPFEGRELAGWPILTMANGRVVFREDDI